MFIVTYLPLAIGAELSWVVRWRCSCSRPASTVARMAVGRLGDRRGQARLLGPGVVLSIVGMAALAATHSPVTVLAGATVFGIGLGILQNATITLMYARVGAAEYSTVSAIWTPSTTWAWRSARWASASWWRRSATPRVPGHRRRDGAGPAAGPPRTASFCIVSALFDFDGKVAVVTGGTRGIGLMMARGLLQAGARVYISSRKPDACAKRRVAELGRLGTRLGTADLSTEEGASGWPPRSAVRGRLHILVNNAGATWGAALEKFPDVGWDKVLDLNLKSPFFLTRAFLPLLEAAGTPTTRPASSTSAASTGCTCRRAARPTRTRPARPGCTT